MHGYSRPVRCSLLAIPTVLNLFIFPPHIYVRVTFRLLLLYLSRMPIKLFKKKKIKKKKKKEAKRKDIRAAKRNQTIMLPLFHAFTNKPLNFFTLHMLHMFILFSLLSSSFSSRSLF